MDYSKRMAVIAEELTNLLSIYNAPKHLDTTAKQADAIKRAAESINQAFPTDTTEEHLRGSFERAQVKIHSNKTTNAWPSSKELVAAVRSGMGKETKVSETVVFNTYQINANRILSGEPVGESWISGRLAAELIKRNLVSKDDLRPYRNSYYQSLKGMYGEEYAKNYFTEADTIFTDTLEEV